MFTFTSIKELKERAVLDKACRDGLNWINTQSNINDCFNNLPQNFAVWCAMKGYKQAISKLHWSSLSSSDIVLIVTEQPTLIDKYFTPTIQSKIAIQDWLTFFTDCPKYVKKYFTPNIQQKLSSEDWVYLLFRDVNTFRKYALDNKDNIKQEDIRNMKSFYNITL